jgi:hypothetical protein
LAATTLSVPSAISEAAVVNFCSSLILRSPYHLEKLVSV